MFDIDRKELIDAKSVLDVFNHVSRVREVGRQSCHQSNEHRFHVYFLLALFGAGVEQFWKGVDVELLREALDHAVQQILLRHGVFGPLDEFQQLGQHNCLVNFDVQALQTANPHQILPDQHLQVILLLLPFVLIPSSSDTHPQIS
jgi:hypothetical protein